VIGLTVTRDGIPVRCWCWPGNTPGSALIRAGQAGHAGLVPGEVIWVADRGFSSAKSRRFLLRGAPGRGLRSPGRTGSSNAVAPSGLREKTGVAIPGMEIGQMYRLGMRLVELSAETAGALGDITLTLGETAVLQDAIEHPGSSVSTIRERTGFTQGRVSALVVRLKQRGMLVTAGDSPHTALASAWRSGTRVRPTAEAMRTITRRVDEAVVGGVANPSEAGRAIALMDELAAILL
jgi:DNA-binding MarR family transcriptional regulator